MFMTFTVNMGSLWIDYSTLIISTIFYLLYLKFTYLAKKAKKINHSEDENKTKPKKSETTNDQEINTENNPNIDEMISSLNDTIQSISSTSNKNKNIDNVTKCNHNNNEQSQHQQKTRTATITHHLLQNHRNNTTNTQINSQSHNNLSLDSEDECKDETNNLTPQLNNFISSPVASPRHKIKAIPILSEAYNEILTLSNATNNNTSKIENLYYDTAEFENESEYDTDTLNDDDYLNKQLRDEINDTLHKINPISSTLNSSKSSHNSSFTFPSRTCSVGSQDTFHAPSTIKEALNNTFICRDRGDLSQSVSPLNMHRYQYSGSTESGSDFDKFIQENEFLLNEEYSSSDLNHTNSHHHDRRGSHESNDTELNEQDRLNNSDHDDELEVGLKECDVDLTQFPKETEIFPTPTQF